MILVEVSHNRPKDWLWHGTLNPNGQRLRVAIHLAKPLSPEAVKDDRLTVDSAFYQAIARRLNLYRLLYSINFQFG
jgi:hypothetical protein